MFWETFFGVLFALILSLYLNHKEHKVIPYGAKDVEIKNIDKKKWEIITVLDTSTRSGGYYVCKRKRVNRWLSLLKSYFDNTD